MKKNKMPKTLGKRFGKLFDYLIDRRTFLVRSYFSRKDDVRMCHLLDKYSVYKGRNWSDRSAAHFIWNHFTDLRQLIPSREHNVLNELENIWLVSKNFFINDQKEQLWK